MAYAETPAGQEAAEALEALLPFVVGGIPVSP